MLARQFLVKQLSVFRRWSSSKSKSFLCDRSTLEAYQNNDQFKEIIDRQEHQFFYHHDDAVKAPSVFKSIPKGSPLPANAQSLTDRSSIDQFVQATFWNDFSKGYFPGLIGLEILAVREGYVQCQLQVHKELLAPNGYLHAGVVVTVADTACGYGCVKSKPEAAYSFTTIELKSNFMGTVKPPALITCEARLLHGGKTTQVWDAQVKDAAKDKLIAVFRCTQLLIY